MFPTVVRTEYEWWHICFCSVCFDIGPKERRRREDEWVLGTERERKRFMADVV